jgi:hypothetical protein
LQGRLAIDNPLDRERFEHEMQGKPAILVAHGARGRAVLFSPHPEMGDLIRKYIALDGYVRHYLPIRGAATMRDTLRHYRVTDAPAFRLVLNAVHALLRGEAHSMRKAGASRDEPADATLDDGPLRACRRALAVPGGFGTGEHGELVHGVASGIAARLEAVSPRFAAVSVDPRALANLAPSWRHLASTIAGHALSAHATVAQRLMEADLAVSLVECWTRAAEMDRALAAA